MAWIKIPGIASTSSVVSGWATAFWSSEPAFSLASLNAAARRPLAVFFFVCFCLCASAANGGQVWAIWMSQPSPHCVRVRWVKPLVRCFSPGERIWKGLLVSCNGRLFSVTHLKFKPPLLFFNPNRLPWVLASDRGHSGDRPHCCPKRPSKCCGTVKRGSTSAPPTAKKKPTPNPAGSNKTTSEWLVIR